jgi:hypothetical protein
MMPKCAGIALGSALTALPLLAAPQERVRVPELRDVYRPSPVTTSVDAALAYLARSQLPDGSWLSGWGKNTGVVSLAVMAFLAAGHVPGKGEHGAVVEGGIRFLLGEESEGMIIRPRDTSHGPMYEHGIATLLLGEVRGMVDESLPGLETLPRVHRRAVDLILRAQRTEGLARADVGGWRYTPTSKDSDLSVTGWQILALRAAQDAEVSMPKAAIERAVEYVKRCALPGGGFAYMPERGHEPNIAMTGTGVLALQICGDFDSPLARRGGDWLLAHPLEWKGPFFFYSAYYSTQAMFQLGGDYWERWRPLSQDLIVSKQRADGSWLPPPDETSVVSQLGPVYFTSMAVLSLTVEYKYLPIYQR